MHPHPPPLGAVDIIAPVFFALVLILLGSSLKEPTRQKFMAIFVAGAGAAYLNGGLGLWEFGFTAVATYVAYRGLDSYRFIALGWVLHVGWDVTHHLFGRPIVYFAATSSAGCAITDSIIAVWFFFGAPRVYDVFRAGVTVPPAFHLLLSDDELKLLRLLAEREGLNASDYLRSLLRQMAGTPPHMAQVIRLGAALGGKIDLSTLIESGAVLTKSKTKKAK